ncbi:MAG: alpha/beta hydrolase [Frankiales bacterium]|nr:alpha/beta hydrolase [Frankiales bacterium]
MTPTGGPLLLRPPVAGGLDCDLPGDGVRLRATRWPGRGPAVLLLHGLASSRRFWDLVVPSLAGHALLALDQRGHGDSERPDGPYDGATVVADALTALDALGLSRVVVVGHSWGASTALRLAASAPERVLAAVAVDGGFLSAGPAGTDRERARQRMTPPRTALPPERLVEVLRAGALGPWWSPEVEAALLPLFGVGPDGLARARLPFEAHMAIVDDLLDDDGLEQRLSAVRCPTWLVSCEASAAGGDPWSQAKRSGLERAGALLAEPRLLRWAGAVHDVPLQWPELVAGLVRAAVSEVAPAADRAGSTP